MNLIVKEVLIASKQCVRPWADFCVNPSIASISFSSNASFWTFSSFSSFPGNENATTDDKSSNLLNVGLGGVYNLVLMVDQTVSSTQTDQFIDDLLLKLKFDV